VALADSWTVAPTEFSVAVPGETDTVATGSDVPVGVSVFEHEARKPIEEMRRRVRTARDERWVWTITFNPDAELSGGRHQSVRPWEVGPSIRVDASRKIGHGRPWCMASVRYRSPIQ
jgi:hypothetical protein